MKDYPFPIFLMERCELSSGYLYDLPAQYDNIDRGRLYKFYMKSPVGEVFIDFLGFSCYRFRADEMKIFVGLNIEGFFRSVGIFSGGAGGQLVLSSDQFHNCISSIERLESRGRVKGDSSSQLANELIHELLPLNASVKNQSKDILNHLGEIKFEPVKRFFDKTASAIEESANLISLRIALYRLLSDHESAIKGGGEVLVSIYKQFDGIRRSLAKVAKTKSVKIEIEGECRESIRAVEFIGLLPLVLLENAIKYSPGNSVVFIRFDGDTHNLNITVESMGPVVELDETEKLFERGYRGLNARMIHSRGGGLGLYLAKMICDMSGYRLEAKTISSGNFFSIGDVPYGLFRVIVTIPLELQSK